jgi:hypothetical protein
MAARLWLVKTRDDAGARHLATFVLTFDDCTTVVAAVAGHSDRHVRSQRGDGDASPTGQIEGERDDNG